MAHLGGQRYNTNEEEVMEVVQSWFCSQSEKFFAAGIHKLPEGGRDVLQNKDNVQKCEHGFTCV
jgi:hypothetical protein